MDYRTLAVAMSGTGTIPTVRGLYVVFSDTGLKLLPWSSGTGAFHVRKADDGLRPRIVREHGGDTGRSVLRRSLAGLLKEELQLVARHRSTRAGPTRTVPHSAARDGVVMRTPAAGRGDGVMVLRAARRSR